MRKEIQHHSILGTFIGLREPRVATIAATAGFDAIVIDMEHGSFNIETVENIINAAHASDIFAIVRFSGVFSRGIQGVLEAGADGIIVPMIENKEQLQYFIDQVKYPPLGKRGFHPFTPATEFGRIPPSDVINHANDRIMIAAQIEPRKGLEKVREIASVEGLDMLFFGPGDFSVSTGVAMNDASVFSASKQVSEVAFNSQRLFGTFVMRKEDIASAKQAGAKLVVCASDTLFLSNSMKIDDGD